MPLCKAGETRGFCSIGKYLQGPGEIKRLPDYTKLYGDISVAVLDPLFLNMSEELQDGFERCGQSVELVAFNGECSADEIERVKAIAAEKCATSIIGIGGGKTLDTARAVGAELNIAEILCPTSASSDAPTSGLSVVYNADHTCRPVTHKKHPEYVLVDTDIIKNAPPRMFAAGIGDALATYFEAVATKAGNNVNNFGKGYAQTLTGMAIARLCFDTIMSQGLQAYRAAERHIRTEAFENVVEANTLMSGLGTENTGCNISHGVCVSLSILPETHRMLHGEMVAFGTLCQLALENADAQLFRSVYDLCKAVKLPVSLRELGICEDKAAKVRKAFEYGMQNKPILQIPNYTVNQEKLCHAVLYVDSLSES